MPIYDFQCRQCGCRFEELVRSTEMPACPQCKIGNAERLFPLSVAVSTDKSRARTTKIARRAANAVSRDKKVADAEYTRNYIKEHSEGG